MKPVKTLLFFVVVMVILLFIMLVFPEKGITITQDVALEFPTVQNFFNEKNNKPDTNSVLASLEIPDDNDEDSVFVEVVQVDTIQEDNQFKEYVPRPIAIDSIRQELELPSSGLQCLNTIFSALSSADDLQSLIRILHYGDSQIETDRITGYLRYKLQAQFGGSGPGLIPAQTAYNYKSPLEVVNSGTWKRYTIFPKIDTTITHYRYGVLASFSMLSPPVVIPKTPDEDTAYIQNFMDDLLHPEDREVYTGSIKFVHSNVTRANVKLIKQIRMFYGNCKEKFSVKVSDGENILYSDSISPSEYYSVKKWTFAESPKDLQMEFSGTQSPEIYGFAMDGNSGIAVDNIPLRGCSGTIFTKMNSQFLQSMYKDLHVKCLILQFGGNTVPSLKPENVHSFKSSFAAQLRLLRRICPDMSIIVIGPADMSTKNMDNYETYEVLPMVVEDLRQAAFENDCAFWDMYSAMGGQNTMPDWVFHEPPLAEKDFVHFTPQGANVIAKMFYNAFIGCYNRYLSKNK
ncbi:MAG: GDSL-type esterase/lipase family protein [Bacteroidales bacterium]|nr:GDSL-type esterase/lipase family protein [Bacteroidales bacterium]